ncbi:MAG: VCBS repeat-containing protein [Polyangiaceae bacterium]
MDGSLNVLLGRGDGTFDNAELAGPRRRPTALALADFDGDGRQDLVVTHSVVVDKPILALGRGDGTFGAPSELSVPGESQTDVVVGYFDDDARPDIIVANQYTHDLTALLNRGAGGFTTLQMASKAQPQSLALGYLEPDSGIDLLVGVWSLGGVRVIPMRGSGLGWFSPFPEFDPEVFPGAIAVADLNRDDHPDIVVAGGIGVHVRRGQQAILEYEPGRTWTVDGSASGLVVADLDRDGNLDVAVACPDASAVEVLFGAGDATFSRRQRFPVGLTPLRLLARDLNGDGRVDLAVANRDSNSVSILLASARRACH